MKKQPINRKIIRLVLPVLLLMSCGLFTPATPTPVIPASTPTSTPVSLTFTTTTFSKIPSTVIGRGESVEFVASVFVYPFDYTFPSSGSVTISSEGETGCTEPLINGKASCTITFTTPGNKMTTAAYSGTGIWAGSEENRVVVVGGYKTQTRLSVSMNSDEVGQRLHIEVNVSALFGGLIPTGKVRVNLCQGGETDLMLVNGSASCNNYYNYYNSSGPVSITALYLPQDSAGNTSDLFMDSSDNYTVILQPVVEPPPPDTGAIGCFMFVNDTWSCAVPCPDPNNFPEACSP